MFTKKFFLFFLFLFANNSISNAIPNSFFNTKSSRFNFRQKNLLLKYFLTNESQRIMKNVDGVTKDFQNDNREIYVRNIELYLKFLHAFHFSYLGEN